MKNKLIAMVLVTAVLVAGIIIVAVKNTVNRVDLTASVSATENGSSNSNGAADALNNQSEKSTVTPSATLSSNNLADSSQATNHNKNNPSSSNSAPGVGANFTSEDIANLENSQYNGSFVSKTGDSIKYHPGKIEDGGNGQIIDHDKEASFVYNNKTVFILIEMHKHGTVVNKPKLCSTNSFKDGCNIFALCAEPQNGAVVASKVLIIISD